MEVRVNTEEKDNNDEKRISAERKEIINSTYLDPSSAKGISGAVRAAFHVGGLGMGVIGKLTTDTSLLISMTIEGVVSVLLLGLWIAEITNLFYARCTGRHSSEDDAFIPGHSLYLYFEIIVLACNIGGVGLVGADMAARQRDTAYNTTSLNTEHPPGTLTIIGLMLWAISFVLNEALKAKYKALAESKNAKVDEVKNKENDNEIEMRHTKTI